MYEVGVVGSFEAAHRLRGNFGPATRRHGHTYRVEVAVRGRQIREDGTLCDIGVLQSALKAALEAVHFRDLDELEAFRETNSTAEALARYLHHEIAPSVRDEGIELLAVSVWESPNAYAAYEARPVS